ncbi:hypothetical protein ACQE3E_23020 [Methylomonas sp. MED-D]
MELGKDLLLSITSDTIKELLKTIFTNPSNVFFVVVIPVLFIILWRFLQNLKPIIGKFICFSAKKLSIKKTRSHMDFLSPLRTRIPQDTYNSLSSFLNNALLNGDFLNPKSLECDHLEVLELKRKFKISGKKIITNEDYKFRFIESPNKTGIKIFQVGAGIPNDGSYKYKVKVKEGRKWVEVQSASHTYMDRIACINIPLRIGWQKGTVIDISFSDDWDDVMLPHWDLVFVPQACYYGSINNLTVEIAFDTPPKQNHQFILYANLISGQVLEHNSKINNKGSNKFSCDIGLLPGNTIIYWVFER